ncbi:MAG: DUF2189 domain-containing protein [Sandarakinorhabdus sp.]
MPATGAPTGQAGAARPARAVVRHDLALADLRAALVAGWQDYRAHPAFGMFFGGIYVVSGWFLTWVTVARGEVVWLVPAAAGFPLLAPFCAVGLYEVSRRRAAGLPLRWGPVLGAVRGRGDEQILSMGVILFVAFGFWVMIAHGIFAVFLAQSGIGSESLALFHTTAGQIMLLFGGGVGAGIALAFYTITVISLPMLVDRDVDFLTAIATSMNSVLANRLVMLTWAAVIAIGLTAAMLPGFLGLLIVLPVLGHATWHLYRRALILPA